MKLMNLMQISGSLTESAAFSPLSLQALKLWLDVSDLGSITKDGSNFVSQLNDKSGNANHFFASGTGKPLYGNSSFNTVYPGLTFDGTDDYMVTTSGNALVNTALPATIVMVFKKVSAQIAPRFFQWKTNNTSINGTIGSYQDNTFGPWQLETSSHLPHTWVGGAAPDTSIHKVRLAYNGSGYGTVGNWSIVTGTTTETGGNNGPTGVPATESYLAARSDFNAATFANIIISEVIVTNATLSADDLANLNAYLFAKWAI